MRILRLLLRYNWSFPLSVLSFYFFVRLAAHVRKGDLGSFDGAVASWLQGERGHWDGLMLGLTYAGGESVMAAVAICTVLALQVLKQRRAARFAGACGVGALLLPMGLKLLFRRARPESVAHYLVHAPKSFSFPSGHALGSTCVVTALLVIAHALRLPLAWRLMATGCGIVFVLGVATSRVYLGVHYASDVLAGMLAGVSWVTAAAAWFYPQLLPEEASANVRSRFRSLI